MDNVLQTALAEAVNSLASFFGTTTEAVMTHAPDFLVKYGWYSTLSELPLMFLLSFLITGLICVIGIAFFIGILEMELKHPVAICVGIFVFCLVICIGSQIITCAVAPEIVGVRAVLELLENMR